MILAADLHLREESAGVILDEVLPGLLAACVHSGERELAILGDLYHFRYRIDVRIQNAVRAWLLQAGKSGVGVIMLPGNHDQVDFAGRNALEVFSDVPGAKVYNEPTWDKHGLWIPYRKNPDDIAKALSMPVPQQFQNSPRVLFMHHGLRGALMNDTTLDLDGLPLEWFGAWSRVLCGHYHKRQDLGRVTYIGSPWQTKADEAGQPKGYAHWNNGALQFVDMDWGPRYHNFTVQKGQSLELSGVRGRDIVKITTGPGVDLEKIGALLAQSRLSGTVTPEVTVAEARISLPEGSSLDAYATEYVKLSETTLDKDKLMTIFKEVTCG